MPRGWANLGREMVSVAFAGIVFGLNFGFCCYCLWKQVSFFAASVFRNHMLFSRVCARAHLRFCRVCFLAYFSFMPRLLRPSFVFVVAFVLDKGLVLQRLFLENLCFWHVCILTQALVLPRLLSDTFFVCPRLVPDPVSVLPRLLSGPHSFSQRLRSGRSFGCPLCFRSQFPDLPRVSWDCFFWFGSGHSQAQLPFFCV